MLVHCADGAADTIKRELHAFVSVGFRRITGTNLY